MKDKKSFYYGTQYYRFPNPPRDQHRYHIKKIKEELEFNILKLFLQWNTIHIDENKFDFEEVNEILDICNEEKIQVLILTNLETAPYWIEQKYPESRYVSANGRPAELGPNGNAPSGGYPGLCFHHEIIRKEEKLFLSELVKNIKGYDCIAGYDCWNEPHLEPTWIESFWSNTGDLLFCYCEESKKEFRKWLKIKYKNIKGLNDSWARAYQKWDQINPPNKHGNYADWLDWRNFWVDSLKEHMIMRYKTIKDLDPKRFVMSHSGAVPPFLPRSYSFIDNWALSEPVDKWGTSMAPLYHKWDFYECAGVVDVTRSAAEDKEIWISELVSSTAQDGKSFSKTRPVTPRDIKAWNWLSVFYGAKGILYWAYLTESTGLEAGNFGLIRFNGKNTDRALEAKKQCGLINKYYNIFKDYKPKEDIAILFDHSNSMLLFAMENTDVRYCKAHIGYYESIWKNDFFARYVTFSSIDSLKEKILIIPMGLSIPENIMVKIKDYVKNGGILISDCRLGSFNENGFIRPDFPSPGLNDDFGILEEEPFYYGSEEKLLKHIPYDIEDKSTIYKPKVSIEKPLKTDIKIDGYLIPLISNNSICMGKHNNNCIALEKSYGKGKVYYFGFDLGLSLYNGDKGAHKLLKNILNIHLKPIIKSNELRPRIIINGKEGLLGVFNDNRTESYIEEIELPEKFSHAIEIQNGEKININENKINILVEPKSVKVIYLTK